MTNSSRPGVVVSLLKAERTRLANQLQQIDYALSALGSLAKYGGNRKRVLSADARKRISLAQKARWAKSRTAGQALTAKPRRAMSTAARKRIAAAQKARWAAWKAKQKETA